MDTKKKIIISSIISLVVVLTVILVLGNSLAYLRTDAGSNNNNILNLADFQVDLITDISEVTVSPLYPMNDIEGLSRTPLTFSIQNNGDIPASYKVSLVDKTTVSTLLNGEVRYQLKRTKGANPQEIFEITNLDSSGLIDSGSIAVNEIISYELKLWQDINSTSSGVTFSKVVLVEGMQANSLDLSGANYPKLLDNMIPVYYYLTSNSTGEWKKADSKNLNATYKWFDYDNFMWANAVTVKESGTQTRDYYLNAAAGTTINMSDITAMWVWIPRYKYVVFNANNGTSDEQMIDVVFEHGIHSTGTITCVDNISNSATSSSSQTCTDSGGSIVNGKSTYTHPAFTFGDEELTGFWIGKFEASTDDATCTATVSSANCNKTGFNILIKPDVKSLRYQTISYLFANMRSMELSGNIHGFNQSSDATSFNNASGNLTGEIANDNNKIDTHMIKNMEWGAVAYLSQSKYGKYGNEALYRGNYRIIYANNNVNYLTGYSSGTSGVSNNSYEYDAHCVGASEGYYYGDAYAYGTGYAGPGASSTGTVYGVYDLSGGVGEYVMGNQVNSSGLFAQGSSAVSSNWSTTKYPLDKYYDKYSYYSSDEVTATSGGRGKLGDATKEVTKSLAEPSRWNNDYNYMPYGTSYPWFERGGYYSGTTNAGVFASYYVNGAANQYYGSRAVLTISRELPWVSN